MATLRTRYLKAIRYVMAATSQEIPELLRKYVAAIAYIKERFPAGKIEEAKRTLASALASGTTDRATLEATDLALHAVVVVKRGSENLQGFGGPLFRAILQVYTVPPALRKKVELALRFYAKKLNPRDKGNQLETGIARLEAYENLCATLDTHLALAKKILEEGKEHADAVDDPSEAGATKVKVGPFTVVNAGGFDVEVMKNIVALVHKATEAMTRSGFGKACYGEIFVTNTIKSSNVAAYYVPNEDKLYIRANIKANWDTLQVILHELGHRWDRKFQSGKTREVGDLYRQLAHHEHNRSQAQKDQRPKVGEKATHKGKEYTVIGVRRGRDGWRVDMKREDNRNASAPLETWLAMRGEGGNRNQEMENPNYEGFVSDYAESGGPHENFAEMFAYYCLDKLPVKQSTLFEALVF